MPRIWPSPRAGERSGTGENAIAAAEAGSFGYVGAPRNVTAERYEMIADLWSRTQRLANEEGQADEWALLAEQAHEKLDPVVSDLAKNADVRRQIDQHLLWMSRDYLLPTIDACLSLARQPAAERPRSAMKAQIEHCESKLRGHIDAIERVLRRERKRS